MQPSAAGSPSRIEIVRRTVLRSSSFKWMLQRAIEAGVPLAWVTADEAYGQAKYLRV
ncbi:hypothetical protein ACFZDJ_25495 [Streptomyces sp. NPDC007896]|uniref:hypothetical protein n=1 Tax=Streptomyces sp. NPDC007896 TaxID=3364784 RepID=UPI0036E35216